MRTIYRLDEGLLDGVWADCRWAHSVLETDIDTLYEMTT
jgi:hypothetical protein